MTKKTELVTCFDLFDRNDEAAMDLILSGSSTVADSEHSGCFLRYILAVFKSVFFVFIFRTFNTARHIL